MSPWMIDTVGTLFIAVGAGLLVALIIVLARRD